MAVQTLPAMVRGIAERLLRVDNRLERRVAYARASSMCRRLTVGAVLFLWWTAVPALAQNTTGGCKTGSLSPLVSLLNTINQLLFVIGIALGGIGFVTAGILFVVPGQKYNRLAQTVAKNTFIGLLLILSSDMIIQFLVGQLGGIC